MINGSWLDRALSVGRPIRKVLVGVRPGERGREELRGSLEVTRALGATVQIARAIPLENGESGLEIFLTEEDMEGLRGSGLQDLDRMMARVGISPSELIGRNVEIGPAFKVVTETARHIGADLIILWAPAGHGQERHRPGSTVDRVLRCTPCSTLILRRHAPLRIERVLAPVDFSPDSAAALRSGLQFLTQLGTTRGVEVGTLFVLRKLQRRVASQFTTEQIDKFALEELARFTRENSREWTGWVRSRLRIGEPRHEVVRELGEHPADLLVLGLHGHGFHHRALIGSVAVHLAGLGSCSVYVGPPLERNVMSREITGAPSDAALGRVDSRPLRSAVRETNGEKGLGQ
jgi:nucleotide-binding universal stress UspA family protein